MQGSHALVCRTVQLTVMQHQPPPCPTGAAFSQSFTSHAQQAGVLHGGLPKAARQGMLAAFSSGKLQALVVSDMAARGLDVEGCDAVFNLELPETALQYAHRAGRTGRMGAPGVVVSVVTRPQVAQLQAIGRRLGVAVEVSRACLPSCG